MFDKIKKGAQTSIDASKKAAEVLELQGKEEAKKYWTEAKLFKSLFENS